MMGLVWVSSVAGCSEWRIIGGHIHRRDGGRMDTLGKCMDMGGCCLVYGLRLGHFGLGDSDGFPCWMKSPIRQS